MRAITGWLRGMALVDAAGRGMHSRETRLPGRLRRRQRLELTLTEAHEVRRNVVLLGGRRCRRGRAGGVWPACAALRWAAPQDPELVEGSL